jgi:hypothetical protein
MCIALQIMVILGNWSALTKFSHDLMSRWSGLPKLTGTKTFHHHFVHQLPPSRQRMSAVEQ